MRDTDGKYLIFTVAGETMSIGFSDVRMIIAADPEKPPKPVPDMPDYVAGTIVNEGEVVTVISLRKRFGMEHKELSDRDCVILCDGEKRLGLLCDGIAGFREIPDEQVQPAPDVNEQVNARFIKGEFLIEGETCYIITPELIIRPDDEDAFGKEEDQ